MEIEVDRHTLERAEERGTNEKEIKDVIINGFDIVAKRGRKSRAKIYEYGKERLGRYYEQKKVEVFYIFEKNKIVTVTEYVFYGKWEE